MNALDRGMKIWMNRKPSTARTENLFEALKAITVPKEDEKRSKCVKGRSGKRKAH